MSLFKRKPPACTCVVAAAGSSTRMGQDKLFLDLAGEPVLLRTLRALSASPAVESILVVTREDLLDRVAGLCQENGLQKVAAVLIGGDTRLESVYRGVCQVPEKAALIAIHDGARPLVSQAVISAAVETAAKTAAAAPAVPVKDTVKETAGDKVTATLDRETLRCVQTPQVFDADLIRAALQKAMDEGTPVTDDCSAVEALGASVTLTAGDEANIKVTTPLDMAVAAAILSREVE